MGWSHLIYLLVGVGIGIAIGFFGKNWAVTPTRTQTESASSPAVQSQTLHHCQEQLQQTRLAYHMASEMSQFKAGFLARVSHELRSPLNGLIGMHQLILNDLCDSPEEEREFIGKAHESALKLMKFIDEMVVVSKTEHGTDRLQIQPIELAQVFREVYNLTHHQAANRNLTLEFSEPNPEVYILADQRRFRQVLVNLVDSAITQIPEGKIRLSAVPMPALQKVAIVLEDDRPETDWAEPIGLLSDPFPSNPPKAPFNGKLSPGLSLMVNKLLLELMDGSLEVISPPTKSNAAYYLQCSIPLASESLDG